MNLGPTMHYFGLWAGMLKIYYHICTQHPLTCLIAKFRARIEFFNLEPKMPYLGVLGRNFKKPLSYLKLGVEMIKSGAKNNISLNLGPKLLSYLESATWSKTLWKMKIYKFGTKNALLGCSCIKIFKKTIVIFKISTLKFVYLQNSPKKQIWSKNALFRYSWARILKKYFHIWNQQPQICLLAKFREKTKVPKFGTKSALFEYFWDGILKKYCHLWDQHP